MIHNDSYIAKLRQKDEYIAHLLSDRTKKFRSRIVVVVPSSKRHDHKLQAHFEQVRHFKEQSEFHGLKVLFSVYRLLKR